MNYSNTHMQISCSVSRGFTEKSWALFLSFNAFNPSLASFFLNFQSKYQYSLQPYPIASSYMLLLQWNEHYWKKPTFDSGKRCWLIWDPPSQHQKQVKTFHLKICYVSVNALFNYCSINWLTITCRISEHI